MASPDPDVTERPEVPPTPGVAQEVFGDHLEKARDYVALLADTGISHGLIGPREAPRLWERHVLGCGVVAPAFGAGTRVADVGSGAGLPGLVIALSRPDLEVTLVEPLHRRIVWLESAVASLGLDNVILHEGRAESLWGGQTFDAVTARAVARIGVLAGWCLPLLGGHGRLVALKGASAAVELEEDAALLLAAGATGWQVDRMGEGLLDPPATLVTVDVGPAGGVTPGKRGRPGQKDRPRSTRRPLRR